MVPTYAATKWEIRIGKNAESFRVGFSAAKTRKAIFDMVFSIPTERRNEIFDILATDANFAWDSKAKEYKTADGAYIRFTGFTERDIKNAA